MNGQTVLFSLISVLAAYCQNLQCSCLRVITCHLTPHRCKFPCSLLGSPCSAIFSTCFMFFLWTFGNKKKKWKAKEFNITRGMSTNFRKTLKSISSITNSNMKKVLVNSMCQGLPPPPKKAYSVLFCPLV